MRKTLALAAAAIAMAGAAFAQTGREEALARDAFAEYWGKIAVGAAPQTEFVVDPAVSKSGRDAYAVTERGGRLVFTGSNGRSLLYAVYDFFGRKGCAWLWDGDVLPPKAAVQIAGTDFREESRFEYRGLRYFAHRGLHRYQAEMWGIEDWRREIDWCVKNRLNLIMLRIGMDDTWQKAFPDIVSYPDPAKPLPEALKGYDNRSLFWSLQERGRLRKELTDYAMARGLDVPTDFGTMTHWYSRTPKEYLEKVKPPLLEQVSSDYGEKTGKVWDIRDPKWLDEYWKLTEAQLRAGYGGDRLLHTIGFGERRIFEDRARNFDFKVDVNRQLVAKALEKRPNAKVLLAGWDFYYSWTAEEVRNLIPKLDPKATVIWDYEADALSENNFTKWNVVGHFPYTFGIFLCLEMALDIRANYPLIERRFAVAKDDPMCKGVIFWPESAHTDTLLLKYFTENAWRPDGKTIDERLHELCAARHGKDAAAFERCWREILPVGRILNYWGNAPMILAADPEKCSGMDDIYTNAVSAADIAALDTAPALFRRLATMDLAAPRARRDALDLARTMTDRILLDAHRRLAATYAASRADGTDGTDRAAAVARVERAAARFVRLWTLFADLLAQHEDYSLNDTLATLRKSAPIANPDFPNVLKDNSSNTYCRSHQYETVAGWILPFAKEVADVFSRAAKGGSPFDNAEMMRRCETLRQDYLARPLESLAAPQPRTVERLRQVLGELADAAAL